MKTWIQILAIAPIVGLMGPQQAVAQEDNWFDHDDVLAIVDDVEQFAELFAKEDFPHRIMESALDCDVSVSIDGNHGAIVISDSLAEDCFPVDLDGNWDGIGHHDFARHPHQFFDKKLRTMERESRDLARKARAADGNERAELEKQLEDRLNEIFDYKLEHQKRALEKIEKRAARMRDQQAERESARDQIIEDRRNELLGESRYLEW